MTSSCIVSTGAGPIGISSRGSRAESAATGSCAGGMTCCGSPGSLKRGWVTASLLISRLQSYRRQNALTRALLEYGRLVKTIFILRYLESEQFRRRINTQLNKGESLHSLREFLFFANRGKIRRKQEEEQVHQATCLNLLTNCVIAWNTVYMACSDRPASHRWASGSRRRSGVSVTLPIRAHQSLRQVCLRGERGPPRGPAPPAPVWAILGLATFCVHLLRDGQNGDQSEAGRLSRRVILGQKTTLGATDLLCHSYQRKPCA